MTALVSASVAVLVARHLWSPRRSLASRVRPYTLASRATLGGRADLRALAAPGTGLVLLGRLVRPVFTRILDRASRSGHGGSNEGLAMRLRQAGLFEELGDDGRVVAYRLAQLKTVALTTSASFAVALLFRFSTGRALAVVGLGLLVGATRQRGRLDRAVEDRRARMRIEIYTINQLLAMRTRSGGGVIQAVARVVERGSGEVVAELEEALRLHRNGMRAKESFLRIGANSPEPYCARTYALLAVAEERGADLAAGLLALAEDVREARREAVKRNATKRRAAMLIPTIAILAPVMLLFIAAPLPRIVFGWQ